MTGTGESFACYCIIAPPSAQPWAIQRIEWAEVIVLDLKNNQILVGTLLDTPASHAVFQRRFGKLLKHPMVPAARSLTLEQLLGFARLYLPKSVIQDTLEELRRL